MSPEEQAYQEEVLRNTQQEFRADELNQLQCAEPIIFISYSKGIRKTGPRAGERRLRRYPAIVELAWYGGKTIGTRKKGDRFDERAAEILGDRVEGMNQQEELRETFARLRRTG